MSSLAVRSAPTGAWAVAVARAGTALIDVCAFWLSATTLTDLARRAGIDPVLAWMWPVIVDGMIVVATVAIVALARHGARATVYPWTLLIAGAAVSVAANSLHALVAINSDLPPALAASVAAVPPLVLLAATHLTVELGRRVAPAATEEAESEPAASSPTRLPARRDTPPTIGRSLRQPRLGVGTGSEARGQAVALAQEGLSNRAIAGRLGVHPSTVGRWLHSPGSAVVAGIPDRAMPLTNSSETTTTPAAASEQLVPPETLQ